MTVLPLVMLDTLPGERVPVRQVPGMHPTLRDVEDLYWFDGPLLQVGRAAGWRNPIVYHWADQDDVWERWLVLPIWPVILKLMQRNEVPVRQAYLSSTSGWLVDTRFDGKGPGRALAVQIADVKQYLPAPGVYLRRDE